jgi:hypothetical protein
MHCDAETREGCLFTLVFFPLVGDISCLPNLLTSFIDMIDTVATERHPDEARRWSYVAPDASREEFGSVSFMPRGNFF